MSKKLTIIVPIYNAEKYLEQSLNSLAIQELDDDSVEYLLINDGSTDGSLTIARHYLEGDARFKVFDRENAGYGATLNFGIEHAEGDYVGVLEPDDWIDRGMYVTMLQKALDSDLDIVRCNYKKVWTRGGFETEYIESSSKIMPEMIFSPAQETDCFFFHPAIWTMIVKCDLIAANNIRLLETPGAAFQDTSYSFKLWTSASSAMLIDKAFVNYRQDNESSSINNPNTSKYVHLEYDEIAKFIARHENRDLLARLMMRRQFLAYVWNYERLDKALHLEFARQAHYDMVKLFKSGIFYKSLYQPWEITDLMILLDSAEKFVKFKDSTPRIVRKFKHLKDRWI